MSIVRQVQSIDRTNGYPLVMNASPGFPWGLFAKTGDRTGWCDNFFFRTKKDATTHGRKCFKVFVVGKVQS